jgi:dUTP pyrophosphatase
MLEVEVKYFDAQMPRLRKVSKGDWIDVRACQVEVNGEQKNWLQDKQESSPEEEVVDYKAGDEVLIHLGFAMKLPEAYEAHVLPRSSTFRKYGFILVNSMGIIDNTYQGEDDEWLFSCYALRSGQLSRYARIGQFRIVSNMPEITFTEVSFLKTPSRGGYGSTDSK